MAQPLESPAGPIVPIETYRLKARMRIRTSDDSVSIPKRVGEELRCERERQGKQLDDVWRTLKILPNYLAAIEAGRFEELPNRAFTIGYVCRYARYLQLDVERLAQRLEAEMAAHGGVLDQPIDIQPLPNRKFPVIVVIAATLLVTALAYWRDDVASLATQAFEQATDEGLELLAPVGQQTEGAAPESLATLPFEVEATEAVPLRSDLLPPLPAVGVTQPLAVRFDLLPPLPAVAVTQPRTVRFDLLPPLPAVGVTQPLAVRFDLLPSLPAVAVTQPRSVRSDFLPAIPQIAVTRPVSLRADLAPATIQQRTRVASLLLPMPLPARITPTPRVSLRADAPLPPGRQYGLQNRNSRITLRVHRPTIVAIRDARNRVFIDRRLAAGDTYRVPNRGGLWLTAIDAGAVEIVLDGTSVGFAGAQGATVRDVPLNPQSIGTRARR